MVYIYNSPESNLDNRYDYQWEILKAALEKTRLTYGDYVLKPSSPMTELRQVKELKKANGNLTVMYLGSSTEFEQTLLPIRIPVDKNLSSYMVYLIRKENQSRFSEVMSLDDLRKFSIGLGLGWIDVDILRASNFNVVTGSSYEGLFSMLDKKRFDAFQRPIVQITEEYENHKKNMPDLSIEENLLFYYPLPMYFWFSKSNEGNILANRAKEGMLAMIEDGTYDTIFYKYHQQNVEKLNLKNRTVFSIENQLLSPKTPFDDTRLWFDPLKDFPH